MISDLIGFWIGNKRISIKYNIRNRHSVFWQQFLISFARIAVTSPARPLPAVVAARRHARLVGVIFRKQRRERCRRESSRHRLVADGRALFVVGEERRLAEPFPQCLAFQAQRGNLVKVGHEAQRAAEALAEPVRGPKAILCAGIVRREARETYLHPNSCLKSIRYSLAKRRRFEQTPLLLSTPLRTECNAIAASDRCDAYACTGPSGNCPLSR